MATKKNIKPSEENEIEPIDLITLLTMPSQQGKYELEINDLPCKNGFELPALESLPQETDKNSISVKKQNVDNSCVLPNQQNSIELSSSPTNINNVAKDINLKNNITNKQIQSSQTATKDQKTVIKTNTNQTQKTLSTFSNKLEIIPGDNLEKIRADISKCQLCGLCKTRTKIVPGEGNQFAKLMFIGEAPGADEDRTGIPFVGKAGQHLDKILAAAGFKRDEVFICNILKCRPPNNRDPNINEMIACTPFLKRQIQIIKPQIIACLGNIATKYMIGPSAPGITRIHGQWLESIFGIKTMPLYHPSYLIRSESREKGSPNWQMWQDIKLLKKEYDSL